MRLNRILTHEFVSNDLYENATLDNMTTFKHFKQLWQHTRKFPFAVYYLQTQYF